MKKAIIHVGLHKTGSTAIQLACQEYSDLLAANGYYYPSFGENIWANHSVPLSLMFMDRPYESNHTIRNMFTDMESATDKAKQLMLEFKREIARNHIGKLLLSAEDLSVFTQTEFSKLINFLSAHGYEVEDIILYVRNPVRFALSNAQEVVRAGFMPLGHVLQSGNLQQAHNKVTKIASVVDKSIIRVMSYEHSLSDSSDIVSHFFAYLGIDASNINIARDNKNASMSIEKTLAVSALCRVNDALARAAARSMQNNGSRWVPSRKLKDYIYASSEMDIEYLAKNYDIHYETHTKEPEPCFDRSVFMKNLHEARKIAMEQAGIDVAWRELFRSACEDTKIYFEGIYWQILVMAYNCTQDQSFKSEIDRGLSECKLNGTFVNDLFHMAGDEINEDTFDKNAYLKLNPDLNVVKDRLFQHYYSFGRFSGRKY